MTLPCKDNASSYHRQVYECLTRLMKLNILQEVNVKDIVKDYPETSHHFDFYIPVLGIIIEVHGQQHYKSGIYGTTFMDWSRGVSRDVSKAQAVINAGYRYIAIPYFVKIKDLEDFIFTALSEAEWNQLESASEKTKTTSFFPADPAKLKEQRKAMNEANRIANKKRYKQMKLKKKQEC